MLLLTLRKLEVSEDSQSLDKYPPLLNQKESLIQKNLKELNMAAEKYRTKIE